MNNNSNITIVVREVFKGEKVWGGCVGTPVRAVRVCIFIGHQARSNIVVYKNVQLDCQHLKGDGDSEHITNTCIHTFYSKCWQSTLHIN